jgi:hypothetical protein
VISEDRRKWLVDVLGISEVKITLATVLTLLVLAASAQATPSITTLGELATNTHASCEEKHLYLQVSSAASLPSYTVPAPGGIITSWSETPLAGSSGSERLVIAQPAAVAGQYTALAVSPEENISAGTFAIHVPVQAGDILGLEPTSKDVHCTFEDSLPAGTNGDLIEAIPGEFNAGELLVAQHSKPGTENEKLAGERLNLQATMEPDADHDGYGDVTEDGCPTDPSTHAACPIPTISGVAQVGQTLSADPQGEPENPTYAWLRCAAGGGTCYAIPNATALSYTVSSEDLGHTLRFRKTATNAQDTQVTESAPTALVPFIAAAAIAPRLTAVSQSANKWREGNAQAHFTRSSKPPTGTTFSFSVNVPTTIELNFTQRTTGRDSAGKCVAPTKHNEHDHACTRTVSAGTLVAAVHLGANKVAFEGRLSPSKKLAPGLYTVIIAAGPAALRSASRSLRFTILGP